MISSFRRYLETWYVRAFFGLMVASFVLWGVGDMLRVATTSTWVAKVAGTTIESQALEVEYRRELAAATRDLPSGQEASAELRHDVVEQSLQLLIGQATMSKALLDMRIVVPDPVLADTARSLPAFKGSDGTFDKTRFETLLSNNGMSEAGFLDLLRNDLARRQLMDAVTAGAHVPDVEAQPIYASQYEKRSADLAAFPFAATPDVPVPDEPAARRWYDNHPDLYATPEFRRVEVIVLSTRTLAADVTVTDKELQAAYADHQADYTTIARRSARVISVQDEAKAEALAEQWRAGADWPAMEAAAKADGAAAIEQKDATQTEYPDPDLAKAVFSAPVNTIPPAVKGALGWFVIQVTTAVEGGVQPFDQVKDKLRERVVAERALDLVYDRANKIDGLIANGTSLEALPTSLGVSAVTATFDKDGFAPDGTVAQLPGEEEMHTAIVVAAFAARKGEGPRLTEVQTPSSGGSGYYALSVRDITPPGEKPFDAVHDAVNDDWRADQRRHEAEVAATAMLQAVKGGKTFSDAARDAGVVPNLSPPVTRTATDPAMPREVQQVLFSLKKGEPTMVEYAEGFLVATPVEIIAPDPKADPAAFEQLRAAITKTVVNDLTSLYSEALRERSNPTINQANVDQIAQP